MVAAAEGDVAFGGVDPEVGVLWVGVLVLLFEVDIVHYIYIYACVCVRSGWWGIQ